MQSPEQPMEWAISQYLGNIQTNIFLAHPRISPVNWGIRSLQGMLRTWISHIPEHQTQRMYYVAKAQNGISYFIYRFIPKMAPGYARMASALL